MTHHISVRVAAVRAGLKPDFSDYILLGDDIVIANSDVAREYLGLMNELGVGISEAKSHVSNDTYEFAKRWYQAGTEITGIQLSSFSSITGWSMAAEELYAQLTRWSIVPSALENPIITRYLGALGQRARDYHKVQVYLNLPRMADTQDQTKDKLRFLGLTWFGETLSCNQGDKVIRSLLTDCLSEAKAEVLHDGVCRLEASYSKLVFDYLQGLVDHEVLDSVPLVAALKAEKRKVSDFRELVDELHWNLDDRLSFSRFSLSACDPIKVTQRRGREIIASNLASIGHYCSNFAKEFSYTRSQLFTDNPVPKSISRFR